MSARERAVALHATNSRYLGVFVVITALFALSFFYGLVVSSDTATVVGVIGSAVVSRLLGLAVFIHCKTTDGHAQNITMSERAGIPFLYGGVPFLLTFAIVTLVSSLFSINLVPHFILAVAISIVLCWIGL